MKTRITVLSRWACVMFAAAVLAAGGYARGQFIAEAESDDAGLLTLDKSVVMIQCVSQDFDYVAPWKKMTISQGLGSGFIIAGNRILTNAHNVSNHRHIEVKKQNLARRYPAVVTYIGHDCDLALLAVLDETFFDDTVALAFGGLPKVNSTVRTYGFPAGGSQVSVTEGVVSRIQMGTYIHTQADAHLVVQTDAAVNPGNSGGPVMQDGKVVGVAFQNLRDADNIGFLIPTTVVEHFLKDIEDGRYDGFGSLGFSSFPGLHNKAYAAWLKVPAGEEGIVVVKTMMHSSVEGKFQKGDVITKIDDYNVDNDAMVRVYGLSVHMSEIIEQKQIGEQVEITFYRDGRRTTESATVALNRPVLDYAKAYDVPPRHVVYAGLTFVPMTRNYLEVWGGNWISDIPFYLRYLFFDSEQLNTERDRKEYVVLSEILPDEVNAYCAGFEDQVVESVNGSTINSLEDMPRALQNSEGGFCVIRFMGVERPLVLDAVAAEAAQEAILGKYGVPVATNLEARQ
ncbi:MAG: trypsin-like peptidase domain-containing protein [Phycisphaerae bacterium]|nr:trypsin-like peptidase domain-containing protein [Phycisphaerae bacterium]